MATTQKTHASEGEYTLTIIDEDGDFLRWLLCSATSLREIYFKATGKANRPQYYPIMRLDVRTGPEVIR